MTFWNALLIVIAENEKVKNNAYTAHAV